MPFTDLAAFRLALSTQLASGSQIADAQLDDMIRVTESKVNKKLRVREMESALSATINSSGQAALPTDYLELKSAYINSSPIQKLERKSLEWLYENYPDRSAGVEKFVAREGSNFIFGAGGTQNNVMKGIYYAKPTAMTATINAVFSAYPEVYYYGALAECEAFLTEDARIALWTSKFEDALNNANNQDEDEGFSGSSLATTNA